MATDDRMADRRSHRHLAGLVGFDDSIDALANDGVADLNARDDLM